MIGSKATAMQASTPVEMKRGSSMRRHVPFLATMVIYILFSLFTIRDFPTVDKTSDDMWNLNWVTTLLTEGKAHLTVNLLPALNDVIVPFNWNTATSALVYKDIEPSIFAMRVKDLLFGIALLVLLYGFATDFFKSEALGLACVVSVGFTNAFLYRSHDARSDILTALMFFITFLISYRIVFSEPVRYWAVFWFPFVVLLTFRHVHPNGSVLGLSAFVTILTLRPSLLKIPKVWGACLAGLVAYGLYEVIVWFVMAQVFPVARVGGSASGSPATQYRLGDYLVMVPIVTAIHGHGIAGVFKSLFHIVGLLVKYPSRMILRIDRHIPTAFIDIAIMGMTVVAIAAQGYFVRSFTRPQRFLIAWVLYYMLTMGLLAASTTDYTIYIMPFFVVILLASITSIARHRKFAWRPVVIAMLGAQVAVAVAVLLNFKFGHRYYDSYVKLDSAVTAIIPAHASVLGGGVYFTMMRPKKDFQFYDIYRSAGSIMPSEEHYFTEANYDFAQAFLKKRIQYVIYDDLFDVVARRVGFGVKGKKTFADSLLGGYDVIWRTSTNYPSIKALIRNVTIYKLRDGDSMAVRMRETRRGEWIDRGPAFEGTGRSSGRRRSLDRRYARLNVFRTARDGSATPAIGTLPVPFG
jgi:hypothetical protein